VTALAPTIMIQGTSSSVGKSLLVTALCRWFRRAGVRVAPFKSQNMALNAAVTPDGKEIGRAQAVQADAAGLAPTADMNPILIKPEGDARSQIVVMGAPMASMTAVEYHARKRELSGVIAASLERLRGEHELVVIEGAGSPAEINLKDRDIVNMHVARMADAPVLLVGDIDRGGVFASFVGTLALLDDDERERVAAFVVNKFRGDRALLEPGLVDLTRRTGKPVAGVLPFLHRLRLADEDSVALDDRSRRAPRPDELDVVVVRLPRISNHDDALALEHEPGVFVRFSDDVAAARAADLVILPGSKSTAADLTWLRAAGFADMLAARAAAGAPILGICGGCQMLGEVIDDPDCVESTEPHVPGLGLLPLRTRFAARKVTAQVRARPAAVGGAAHVGDGTGGGPWIGTAGSFLSLPAGTELVGYEIHMGDAVAAPGAPRAFEIVARNGEPVAIGDGAVGADGAVVGTMIHGLLDNDVVRAGLLAELRRRRGLPAPPPGESTASARAREFDRLADSVDAHMDVDLLWRLARLRPRRT
jgi:adenosylcobyric acid synthase